MIGVALFRGTAGFYNAEDSGEDIEEDSGEDKVSYN
jgi:hypothetical protein